MSQKRGQDAPPTIAGFVEGMLAPVFELVVVTIVTALAQASKNLVTGSRPFYLLLIALFVIDLLRSVGIGLTHSQFALGNIIGNIFGIYIFYSAFSAVSLEAANQSLLFSIVMTGTFVLGIVAAVWSDSHSSW